MYVYTQNKYEIVTWVNTQSTVRDAVLSYTNSFPILRYIFNRNQTICDGETNV